MTNVTQYVSSEVEKIGNNIAAFRKRKNMTITYLAKITGIGRNYLSNIERGTCNPSISMLCKIALALDVDTWELLFIINE